MIGTFLCVKLGVVVVWRNVAEKLVKCCEVISPRWPVAAIIIAGIVVKCKLKRNKS